jgi:hypothetical protein
VLGAFKELGSLALKVFQLEHRAFVKLPYSGPEPSTLISSILSKRFVGDREIHMKTMARNFILLPVGLLILLELATADLQG